MIANSERISARSFFAKQSWVADLVCILLLISIALAIGLPRYRVGIDWTDEGFLAYGTVRVMEGQIPNRDFVSLQPPLSFYLAAGVFKMFGTSLASLRILGLSLYVLIPLLLYEIARQMMRPGFSIMAALPATLLGIPYFGFVPFAVWQGITATLIAIFLLLRAIATESRAFAALAGIVTTLSLLLRHDQAAFGVISILVLFAGVWFTKTLRSSAGLFLFWFCGAAIPALLFLTWGWRQGALPEMFKQLVVFPLTVYGATSSWPFPRFDPSETFSKNVSTLLFYLPPLIIAANLVYLVRRMIGRRFGQSENSAMFLTAWSALFYLLVVTRSDLSHLLVTLPPFFLLCAQDISILSAQLQKRAARISIAGVSVGVTFFFLASVRPVFLQDLKRFDEDLPLARGGVRIDHGRFITDFMHQIQEQVPAARSILSLPYLPMIYFLSERRNPTHWNYIWPGDQTREDHETLIAQARADPPAMIFISAEDEVATFAPVILDFVHRDYRRHKQVGFVTVYLPRSNQD